jgi:hypothetical protein
MPHPSDDAVSPNPDQDLLSALAGDEAAARRLHGEFAPLLLSAATHRNRHLPEDLHGDIVQEIWCMLFETHGLGRAPVTLPAKQLLLSLVSPASDRVRAANRAPGERARFRNERRAATEAGRAVAKAQKTVPLDMPGLEDDAALRREDSAFGQVDALHDVAVVTRGASPGILRVLSLMLESDLSMNAASAECGINRSRLQRWVGSVRHLAA